MVQYIGFHLTPNEFHDNIAPFVAILMFTKATTEMGRPKEFDVDTAVDKAMTLFWQKGYEATSIQDLEAHLGIGRRSLYNTFKSKHDLFIDALDRYLEISHGAMAISDEAWASPKAAIRAIFEEIVAQAVMDSDRKGCLMLNCTLELAGQDDAVTSRAESSFQDLVSTFSNLLDQAQKLGELSTEHDARTLAHFLANTIFGIRAMAKVKPDQQVLTDVIDTTLSVLN